MPLSHHCPPASTNFPPFRLLRTPENIARAVSDNCISRLVTALGGGTISVTLYAVVLQHRGLCYSARLASLIPNCYYLARFNRKGGTRGRFREIGASGMWILSALNARKLDALFA